jgi:hypothetical protein
MTLLAFRSRSADENAMTITASSSPTDRALCTIPVGIEMLSPGSIINRLVAQRVLQTAGQEVEDLVAVGCRWRGFACPT